MDENDESAGALRSPTAKSRSRIYAGASLLVRSLLGFGFASVWLSVSAAWALITLPANLMANDSGAANVIDWITLIGGMAVGQAVFAAAAFPGGVAFVWSGARKYLIWGFVALAAAGVAIQMWAFKSFAAAMGW